MNLTMIIFDNNTQRKLEMFFLRLFFSDTNKFADTGDFCKGQRLATKPSSAVMYLVLIGVQVNQSNPRYLT